MLTVREINPESRKELYLKYTKSNIFNDPKKKDMPYKITEKITSKEYSKQFEPQYDNTTARQRYMNDFHPNKDNKTHSRNYQEDVSSTLFGNTETHENKIKRSKSMFFIDRSFTTRNINQSEMDSRQRKINRMQSDIFFLSKDENEQQNIHQHNNTKSTTQREKIKRSKTIANFKDLIRNNTSHNKTSKPYKSFQQNKTATTSVNSYRHKINNNNPMGIYMKNVNQQINRKFNRSKYSSNTDWKYSNTEEQNKTQPSVNKSYGRKEIIDKGNDRDPELAPYYLTTENIVKKNKSHISNLNSVAYDLISSKPVSSHWKVNSYLNNDTKTKPAEFMKFEIEVGQDFNPANGCKIKNLIRSEGLHLFDFVDTGQCITGPKASKYTFNIRKNVDDPQFEEKLKNVSEKLSKKQLEMVRSDTKYVRPM